MPPLAHKGREAPSLAPRHPQPWRLAKPSNVVVIPALSRDPFQAAEAANPSTDLMGIKVAAWVPAQGRDDEVWMPAPLIVDGEQRACAASEEASLSKNFLPTLFPSRILPSPPAHGTGANDHRDRSLGQGEKSLAVRCPRRGFFRRSIRPGRPFAPPDRPPLMRGLRIGPLEAPQGPKSRQRTGAHSRQGRPCRRVGQTPRGMPEADRMT